MWIVIVGNPLDGLAFHGPFEYSDYAVDSDWWVSEVAPV